MIASCLQAGCAQGEKCTNTEGAFAFVTGSELEAGKLQVFAANNKTILHRRGDSERCKCSYVSSLDALR